MIRVRPGMDRSCFAYIYLLSPPDLQTTSLSEVVEIRIVDAYLTMGQGLSAFPGAGNVNVHDLVAKLRDARRRGVRVALVAIDSGGGFVEAAEVLYRELGAFRDSGGYVVTYLHRHAFSCAAWEWLSADYVVMAPWAWIWAHGPVWSGAAGQALPASITRSVALTRSVLLAETIAPAELIDSWIGTPSGRLGNGTSIEEVIAKGGGAILNAQDAVHLAFCDEIGGWGTAEAIARSAINGTPPVSPRRQRLAARGPAASEGTHQVCTPEGDTMANQPMLVGGLVLGLGAACMGPAESDNQQDSTTRVPDSPCGVSEALPYTPQSGDGLQTQGEDVLSSIPTLVDGESIGLDSLVLSPMVVSNWYERPNPKNKILRSVVWAPSLGMFVAVGERDGTDAYIVTSVSGLSWAEQSNPKNVDLWDVAWSPSLGLFVAVGGPDGSDAYIVTSPDGATWTERANPKQQFLNGITWSRELGIFVAVGSPDFGPPFVPAYIVTSPDGINWTDRANTKGSALADVAWSPALGLFVAVGDRLYGDPTILTSPDGTTWAKRNHPKLSSISGVIWAQELSMFVAVGEADTSTPVGADAYIITSTDGENWTERENPKQVPLGGIVWSKSLGILVAVGGYNITNAYIISSMTLPMPIANLASNPGFESGDVNWTKESTWEIVNDAANARSGSWCARTINPPHSGIYNGVYNAVQAGRGDAFYAEAWIKSSAGATANAYIRISWKNSSGSDLGYSLGNAIGATTSYQKSSVTAAAPAGTAYIQIAVIIAVGGSTGTWYADDVLLKAL